MIKKLKDNLYEVRGDTYDAVTGKRRQVRRRFRTRTEAAAFDRSLIARSGVAPARSVPTFVAYAATWLEYRKNMGVVSPSTSANDAYRIKALAEIIGDVPMSRITPSRIEGVISELRRNKKSSTASNYLDVLRMIIRRAVRDGYLTSDPMSVVEVHNSQASRDIEPPDADALRRILAACSGTPVYLPICIMIMTGMRVGEATGLLWDCVDLKEKTITVRRQRCPRCHYPEGEPVPGTADVLVDHTKTRAVRTVTIPASVVEVLREARKDQLAAGNPSQYVCINEHGIPISRDRIRRALPEGVRIHDLRHAHATILLDAGVPLPEVSRRLGHASTAVTARVYAHALAHQDIIAADAISTALDDTKHDTTHTPQRTTTHH